MYQAIIIPLWLSLVSGILADRISVQGTHFVKDGHRVFLSGTNQAWVHFARDFGNNQFQAVRSQYNQTLAELAAAGGNSIRVRVHTDGQTSPFFDDHGFVNGTDAKGTLIHDLRQYLQDAQQHGILVFFTLWTGAQISKYHNRLDGLIRDPNKLQTYIDHALVPMVNALRQEPALGGWDVINEPEGVLKPGQINADPCQDTSQLAHSGAGWAGHLYSAYELQRFVNRQADAIRRTDPSVMVTMGSANNYACTDEFGFKNLWKDKCLISAGGKQFGILSFYMYHTYARHGHWDGHSPMQRQFHEYRVDKPVVIGEFRESNGAGMNITEMFSHAYFNGYGGAWSWMASDDHWDNQKLGIAWLKNRNNQAKGGLVNFSL